MSDLFGHSETSAPFRDIRSTRESIAEEKARLCLRIGELTRRAPPNVLNGSVQVTRQWCDVADKAKKLAAKARASVQELNSAVSQLESERWFK